MDMHKSALKALMKMINAKYAEKLDGDESEEEEIDEVDPLKGEDDVEGKPEVPSMAELASDTEAEEDSAFDRLQGFMRPKKAEKMGGKALTVVSVQKKFAPKGSDKKAKKA